MNNTKHDDFKDDKARDLVMGLAICKKCNLINKIRSAETIKEGKCKCSGCGTEIEISKKIKNA